MHTISPEARPVRPRDSRKGAQPVYTAQGERIVKRHSGPTALPIGTTIIDGRGDEYTRDVDGMWYPLRSADPHGALDLVYPIVEVLPKQRGHHLDRRQRRADDRAARKAELKLARFKSKRVEQYLAAVKAAEAQQ